MNTNPSQVEEPGIVTGERPLLTIYSRSTAGAAEAMSDADDDAAVAYADELRRWRERRGLSKQRLANLMAYSRSYVSHIEGGKMAPTDEFTRQADDVLGAGGALWACWEALLGERARSNTPAEAKSVRDLRTTEFVSWLVRHSEADFDDVYRAVATQADQFDQEASPVQHARHHRRSNVTRADLAQALASYYELPDGHGLYRPNVANTEQTLSLLVEPDWLDAAIQLRSSEEHFTYDPDRESPDLTGVLQDGAISRLAEVEVNQTVMVNSPIYRLKSIDLGPGRLDAQVALADYASYALTSDLMELELVDAVANSGSSIAPGQLPIRDRVMPTITQARSLTSRQAAGGPACLLAIARPARQGHPPDYALLVQERSGKVLNAAGKLAVIPKAFHQPIGEAAEEALLSATLIREFEEELLGRQDLEDLGADSWRQVDLLHESRRSEPLTWLLEQPTESFRTECTSFGINLVTGTYEFACLMVIEDERWWTQWGHQIEANWEAMRVHRYSSRDTKGLAKLANDPRWSNEGLFAFLEGLRRLRRIDQADRVACPSIDLREP